MYHVYLDGMELPVTPSKITAKIKNQNETVNLINEGEVNILKQPGLTSFSFDFAHENSRLPTAGENIDIILQQSPGPVKQGREIPLFLPFSGNYASFFRYRAMVRRVLSISRGLGRWSFMPA